MDRHAALFRAEAGSIYFRLICRTLSALLKNCADFSIYRKVSISESTQTGKKKSTHLKPLQKEKGSVPCFIGTEPWFVEQTSNGLFQTWAESASAISADSSSGANQSDNSETQQPHRRRNGNCRCESCVAGTIVHQYVCCRQVPFSIES